MGGVWLVGIIAAAIGLVGLILAAMGLDIGIEIFGCGVFALGTLFVFLQMKKDYDAAGPKPSEVHLPAE